LNNFWQDHASELKKLALENNTSMSRPQWKKKHQTQLHPKEAARFCWCKHDQRKGKAFKRFQLKNFDGVSVTILILLLPSSRKQQSRFTKIYPTPNHWQCERSWMSSILDLSPTLIVQQKRMVRDPKAF
jgi:hypothetical protein